ncbi:MAG: 1,4-dihydroxy-2-naphthoate octaprenyltransferase [Alphaproteobacteria bacterium]|nr:1,4-dihydroxy-2-naphthoate octaprenyltransferase [Alphaproteobacteria bacterium]
MTALAAAPAGARLWLLAVRPGTLSLSVVPVLAATALAWAEAGRIDGLAALVAMLSALLIQAGTNLHNDAADCLRGNDGAERLGPLRVTAQGWASAARVVHASKIAFGLAAALGVWLAWVGGWPILALGAASIIAGWAYSGGPNPIAHTPLGEVFVVAFFGLGATCGTTWLHLGALTPASAVLGLALGLQAAAVLAVNNIRDVETDRRAGRRTLAVLLGRPGADRLFAALVLAPLGLLAVLATLVPNGWRLGLAALVLPEALRLIRTLSRLPPGPHHNILLKQTARMEVAFAVLIVAGLVFLK